MAESLFSTAWYRVAELRPQLRSHARIHRHRYRGHVWFVMQDLSTGRFHRFTPTAYRVIGLIDGTRTVEEIWRLSCGQLGDDAPTQDEMIRLLAQLHAADVLQSNVPPDTAELFQRHQKLQRRNWMTRLMSPFAVQIPLFDPEKILRRTVHFVEPLVGWPGLLLWLAVVLPAAVLVGTHFSELTEGILDRVLTPRNLVLVWLLFPFVKALHEFGHAYVAKALGGEIHDMGIMLLVFTPIPYVDASSASAFPRTAHRVAVGAGGMLVEVFVAALAMYVWVSSEPGTIRTLAFNAMLIGGVTTLAFNANPLLRFDGYYILSDLLEIPNLRQRSNAYIGYLVERYLLGRADAEPPQKSEGERAWLASYAVASFAYRLVVIVAIALFVLSRSFVLGVMLLALSAVSWVIVPAVKGVRYLLASPAIRRIRVRAVGVASALVATALIGTLILPLPLRTRAEGVVWIPDEAHVRVATEGFIERVVARPGAYVREGDVLFECRDPMLEAQVKISEAHVRQLEARYEQRRQESLVEAQMVMDELYYARQKLARERERAAELTIRSRSRGTFVVPRASDMPGRFVRQGERLADVVDLETITVRAVVPQDDIDLVRKRLQKVDVRLAEHVAEVLPAIVRRIVPAASEKLPSLALSSEGGGEIALDPHDERGMSALERWFEFELVLPASAGIVNVGGRVYVRFDLGSEPLAAQWYRRVRQLFLARFNV